MQQLDDDLWVVEAPQRFLGLSIGTRMSIVRLDDGRLWLCSPVPIDDELAGKLAELGPVGHLVAPNRFHHLYLAPAAKRYPDASAWLAPGLAKKRPELDSGETLSSEPPADWVGQIDQRVLEGVPMFNEVAFMHRASRSLILTDHLFHLDDSCEGVTWGLGRMLGVRKAPGFPRDAKALFIRDRALLRKSIDDVLSWDFDRIVITHGRLIGGDGPGNLQRAYAQVC